MMPTRVNPAWTRPTALALLLASSSCEPLHNANEDNDQRFRAPVVATPVSYSLIDPACQGRLQTNPIGEQAIIQVESGKLTSDRYAFTGSSTQENGLDNGPIFRTIFGESTEERIVISNRTSKRRVINDSRVHAQGRPLQICGPLSSESNATIEAIALQTHAILDQSDQLYRQTLSEMKLPRSEDKLRLNVLPDHRVTIIMDESGKPLVGSEGAMTDNAAWSLGIDEKDQAHLEITIFPQSEEAREAGLFGGFAIFEIPFTLRHEYGHQAFFEHMPAYYRSLDAEGLALWSADRRALDAWMPRNGHAAAALAMQNVTGVGSDSAMSALSEAFSDLFAVYAGSGDPEELAGLVCLEHRGLNESALNDSLSKRLNASALNRFLDDADWDEDAFLEDNAACGPADFRDVHLVGTVLAHRFHRILELDTDKLSAEKRLPILIEWARALNRIVAASYYDLGPRALLKEAVRAFVGVKPNPTQLNALQCQELLEGFPTFFSDWDAGKDALFAECIKAFDE